MRYGVAYALTGWLALIPVAAIAQEGDESPLTAEELQEGTPAPANLSADPAPVKPEPKKSENREDAAKTDKPDTDAASDTDEAEPKEEEAFVSAAILQGLNKLTARKEELEAPFGVVTRFGDLEIIPHKCWVQPAEEGPENAALLEVWQLAADEKPRRIFFGWMFASSPGISSLEHPLYDLAVLKCRVPKPAKAVVDTPVAEEGEAPPAPADALDAPVNPDAEPVEPTLPVEVAPDAPLSQQPFAPAPYPGQ